MRRSGSPMPTRRWRAQRTRRQAVCRGLLSSRRRPSAPRHLNGAPEPARSRQSGRPPGISPARLKCEASGNPPADTSLRPVAGEFSSSYRTWTLLEPGRFRGDPRGCLSLAGGLSLRLRRMGFSGWSPDAAQFFDGLRADNTKAYWSAHKEVYERSVRGPMAELLDELSAEFGPGRIARPNRDIRFRADKSPYKTEIY